MTVHALSQPLVIEEPCAEEVDAFMQEIEQSNRARIFRDMIETGDCGYCGRQTLRVAQRANRWVAYCPCDFRG